MAAVAPQDWQNLPRQPTMDLQNGARQRSSPGNDHSSPASPGQNHQNLQQQLLLSQQQQAIPQSGYTLPAQQQPQGNWTPSINATPFYPSFYQPQLQQQSPQSYPSQLPQQSPYFDPANAQLAQWAYQQMLFNAQHGYSAMPPQHHSPMQRPGGPQLGPNDYFTNQIPSPFNNFPSGTPPPHNPRGGAGDHQGQSPQYPGFHPYRRPNRQQSHNGSDSNNDWRPSPNPGHNQLPHPPYMRSDASGSTSSLNSTGSHRQRTNSNQSGNSGHSIPATGSGSRSRSNTATSANSSSARNSPSPAQSSSPSPSPLRNHHNRNGSSSSSSSAATTTTRPSGITPSLPTTATSPTTTSAAPPNPSPVPRLTRPSPLSQGNFTAEKRMSRDDSDLAAMLSPPQDATSSRSSGLKSRLRRALSFNPSQTLKEEEVVNDDDDVSIKASAINGAASSKSKGKSPAIAGSSKADSSVPGIVDDGASAATVQTKKKGRAASLFNARFNASTDNISLSSTVSSASVMIRKLGSLGNLARRNSLAGITSLFKDKDKDGDKDKKGKKKDKKSAKAEASEASVSHVTAELDRTGDWSVSPELNGLTPAAKLARQHTLKSNAEAAERAKAEREASAKGKGAPRSSNGVTVNGATTDANGTPIGVPTWDKNTATRHGVQPPGPSGPGIHINEDGTRVLVEEEDEDSDDGHYAPSQGHQNYKADGWDDDDWDGEVDQEEDVTIRVGLQHANLESGEEVEAWAVDIRRSAERTRLPKKGILKNAQNYSQTNHGSNNNLPQMRARSNSYNSPATQSELGPLARIPSPDPDHIDGLHRHGSHSSHPSASSLAPEPVPSLPPLSFDSTPPIALNFTPSKDLPDTPSNSGPEQGNRSSAIFQHPNFNSSAPVLSHFGSTSSPSIPARSLSQKRLTFATSLAVYDTFAPAVYDRRSEPATWSRLTPALAQRIKEELNSYKMEEMEVHAASRMHTQFFV